MKTFKLSALLLSLLAIFAVAPMFGAADDDLAYRQEEENLKALIKFTREMSYVLWQHYINSGPKKSRVWHPLSNDDAKYIVNLLFTKQDSAKLRETKGKLIEVITEAFKRESYSNAHNEITKFFTQNLTPFNEKYPGKSAALGPQDEGEEWELKPTVPVYLPSDNDLELTTREKRSASPAEPTPTSATTSPASSSAASSSAASGASPYNEAELKLLQKRIHSASNTTPYKNDPTIKARLASSRGPLADAIRKKLGL